MRFYAAIAVAVAVAVGGVILPLVSSPVNNLLWWWWSVGGNPATADLVVKNATIFTSDPSLPFADSMAIRHGRILRIGNYSSIQELVGQRTKMLNLEQKIVVPGFIDSHVHLLSGGLQMAQVQLNGVSSKQEFVRRIKEGAQSKKSGSWIRGGGWNNDLWGGDLPMASWIDEFTSENPVWLSRTDGHMGLANSLALRRAGVSRDTNDPPGGSILRTSDGEPTGLLIDSAMNLIRAPEISIDERRDALRRASAYALKKGVTTVVDVGRYFPGFSVELSWADFTDVYRWANSSGNMMIRVCLFFPIETWSRLAGLVKEYGRAVSHWIYLGGVKAFADGSLGSNSALFYEPYVDDPENYGLEVTELESLTNLTTLADKHDLQVAVHAIGDRANDLILDMYRSVASTNGLRDRRFRIEHAQHLAPGAASKFGEHRIIASVQPEHLLYDADSAIKKLGKKRAERGSYLFHSVAANNAQLAFGSDWPVADIDPLCTIRTSMKRVPFSWGTTAWIPSECVSIEDALKAHTISAAYACFLDKELGSLSPGKLADFAVLSSDSWDNFKEDVSAEVEATYVGGVQAYPSEA